MQAYINCSSLLLIQKLLAQSREVVSQCWGVTAQVPWNSQNLEAQHRYAKKVETSTHYVWKFMDMPPIMKVLLLQGTVNPGTVNLIFKKKIHSIIQVWFKKIIHSIITRKTSTSIYY